MRKMILAGLVILFSSAPLLADETALSLAGTWRFELDRNDAGVAARWFDETLPARIQLPGDLPAQGIGDPPSIHTQWTGGIQKPEWYLDPALAPYSKPGNFKFPFWLTPNYYYAGPAWYQRDIEIPRSWAGQRVVLFLERPHWETRIWLDDRLIGTNTSLGTPHEYDLGSLPPGKHRLTIRVDNRRIVDVGENSHSITDHTQGNWNGIIGRIELRATPPVWIEDLQVYPQIANRSIKIRGQLGNMTGHPGKGTLMFRVEPKNIAVRGDSTRKTRTIEVTWPAEGASFETELPLGNTIQLWDEFNPALYKLSATLQPDDEENEASAQDSRQVTFGMREIATDGTQFTINGRKTFFRGTLECCVFPRTGHPPTDLESWERILKICRAHGLNLVRFHSWCPPEAAFEAADELGFYFHVECSSWANQSTTLGDGKPVDAWIYQEADRILRYRGNHPSLVLMLYGNEPGGKHAAAYLEKWVAHYKEKDSRHLFSSGSGWPQLEVNQFHVTPDPRIQAWGAGLHSRINAQPPETETDYRDYISKRSVPVISHEIGQWCVYPDFAEIPKYTGYLKPLNFEIFRDSLSAHGMGDEARQFVLASGKLQTLCYKEDIESALRTHGMGGFELLGLNDFPGQGTALVGVLDPFWDEKGYVTAARFSRFCNNTVPLARLPKRVFTSDETIEADLEVAHFGPSPINAVTQWKLIGANKKVIAKGEFPAKEIPVDNGIRLGHIAVPLNSAAAPQQCKLVVALEDNATHGRNERFENDWNIWVYPPKVNAEPDGDITIVNDLDANALEKLRAGGKVLLLIPPSRVRNLETNKVVLGFSSIFWNTAWTGRQPPTTLGILCNPNAPALADFPTEFHSNWQWWYIIHRAAPMVLDGFPVKLRPTVQVIDDWTSNHRLALLFEARVSGGKLLVSSIDLKNELEADPVRRQLRASLLNYMASDRFKPKVKLAAEQVRHLIVSAAEAEKPDAAAPSAADFRQIIDRYRDSVLHLDPDWSSEKIGTADKGNVHHWIATLGADGAWPDIDYASQDRSFWEAIRHLERTRVLARALLDPNISSQDKQEIQAATFRALDFWLAKRFKNPNWWWNEIGVPQAMCDIMALLSDHLAGGRRAQALEVLAQCGKPKSDNGANTIWIADLALQYGAFTGNAAAVAEASRIIAGEIKITAGDGIQSDYSFHQHRARLQQFAYGRSYLITSTRIAWQLDGTPWRLSQAKLNLLTGLVLEGDQWMCRGIYTVPSTLDRTFSRPGTVTYADVRTQTEHLSKLVSGRASELEEFLARQNGDEKPLVGARTFPRSDFTVFHRPAFSFFIKTLSDRTLSAEVGLNAENLKGTLQNDGDNYLVRDGQEYFNVAPVWDWDLLPGVTFAQGAGKPQGQSFAGAVTDGSNCAAAMDFSFGSKDKSSLSGKKFWACHDDAIVCLLSDLNAPEVAAPVRTALDQCRLRGPVTICDESGNQRIVTGSQRNLSLKWVQHSGFAYAPLDHLKVSIRAEPMTGTWSSINKALSKDPVTVPIFLAALEHGMAPKRTAGGFVIVPAAAPTDAKRIFQNPSWHVLRNEPALQAVKFDDGTIAAVFHEPGELDSGGPKLTVDKSCILLMQHDRAWICDPTQQGGSLRFRVGDKMHEIELPARGVAAQVSLQ